MTFQAGVTAARTLLEQVRPPIPLEAAALCQVVAQQRGRRIDVVELAEDEEATGLWHDFQDRDVITYTSSTSPYHQQAIILHELGHLVMDHYGVESDEPIPRALLADFDPDTLRRLRRRHHYSNDEERAAEGFATAVLDAADQMSQSNLGSTGITSAAERQRLADTFMV